MTSIFTLPLTAGEVTISPEVVDGELRSLGAVAIAGTPLRNPQTRFLPWFDTFAGDVFRRFLFNGTTTDGDTLRLHTTAISDPDTLFRERRDSSGDLCFRTESWDDPPCTAELTICLYPVATAVDGRNFSGFSYWFEYASDLLAIHRLVDRQTWELGGNLDDVTICLRNWLTPPRMKLEREIAYSTVGLDQMAGLLPGNLWGRWTLLPSFDMQYGRDGILLGWFNQVSLIRTVIESREGEDCLRCLDMHCFEQSARVTTNAKTILWCPDRLDDVSALNLWTHVHDLEQARSRQQFGIPEEEPPAIVFSENAWVKIDLDHTYDTVLDVAAEFGADYIMIDPIWENMQHAQEMVETYIPEEVRCDSPLEKMHFGCQCASLDFVVSSTLGGETALQRLCTRARDNGLGVISWMATHLSPVSAWIGWPKDQGHGTFGVFAARESGHHPDTGYPGGCWTLNLNAPIARYITEQLRGVCRRTGLAGFLWDSFCNLGWWQLDYSNGTMRPQYDKMAMLYAELANDGLYLMPEAIVSFSSHSVCGLHGGNVYAGDLVGYSYNTNIALWFGGDASHHANTEVAILKGEVPVSELFILFAHKRIPSMNLHHLPREAWDPQAVVAIKELFALYKANRQLMQTRTVLADDAGVLWENRKGIPLFFSFREQPLPSAGSWEDAVTGTPLAGARASAYRAYRLVVS